MRARRGIGALLLAVCCLAGLAAPAPASRSVTVPIDPDAPKLTLIHLELPASNGYRLDVNASAGGRPENASITVTKDRGSASYTLVDPETITRRRIVADFGERGTVRVKFDPRRRAGRGGRCSPFSSTQGVFRGTIRFRGESGFTTLSAVRAPGEVTQVDFSACDRESLPARPSRRRRPLILLSCSRDAGSQYAAFKFRDREEVFHQATTTERQDGLLVFRSAFAVDDLGTFTTKRDLSSARVVPGGRFEGSADFSSGRLTGDLTATVPGAEEPIGLTPAKAALGKRFSGAIAGCGGDRARLPAAVASHRLPAGLRKLTGA